MTEYIILVGLIAVGLVGAIKLFGNTLDVTVRGSEKSLEGNVTNPIATGGGSGGSSGSGTGKPGKAGKPTTAPKPNHHWVEKPADSGNWVEVPN